MTTLPSDERPAVPETVLAAIAAEAVLAVPGVDRLEPRFGALLGSLAGSAWAHVQPGGVPGPTAGVDAEVQADGVHLGIDLAVSGRPAAAVAVAVQQAVADAVRSRTGLDVARVTVAVLDVDPAS
ncbi:Asp23/Gls24 family envelope stress response protein [Modestobacter sp. I12A-02628]|uniref:Asp23/Gls24 family envelope stress response protein n=1 Tax=Goekera deserti TaxID=2497753 RepID=A0A7K3WL88_9ACTN|nr:Asp23/Gls24 family envelope stress response protein [Goekera deserti]MPQ96641.1 Asp23/Gls24 family envelope stress response protein [Goekera deserti]NDI47047.1 Asp23/Gls24 family envelope stress response protein [Goekera deserti]NEL56283.1 Asp23/Gls24 family envelope stress response protein [Goekera deserti]